MAYSRENRFKPRNRFLGDKAPVLRAGNNRRSASNLFAVGPDKRASIHQSLLARSRLPVTNLANFLEARFWTTFEILDNCLR